MATISARIDDETKENAERIAESIGMSLSTVVNIFLRRFIAENGFPFAVKAIDLVASVPLYDPNSLESAVKQAVANPNTPTSSGCFAYFDSKTKQLIEVQNREES